VLHVYGALVVTMDMLLRLINCRIIIIIIIINTQNLFTVGDMFTVKEPVFS